MLMGHPCSGNSGPLAQKEYVHEKESYFFGHADGSSIGIRLWESGKTG